MRSLYEMGFKDPKSIRLGQLDFLPSLISASMQAGAAVYGAHMNQTIAEMQKKTQEDIANKQAAEAQAQSQAQQQAATAAATQQAAAPAAPPPSGKILGMDKNTVIIAGVGLALAAGIVAVVMTSTENPLQAVMGRK